MELVDAHLHIWAPHTLARPWPNPQAQAHESQGVDQQQLLTAMAAAGVARGILIPPSWEGHYNDLALAAAAAHPRRFGVMGRLDPELAASRGQLKTWRDRGFLGLRFIFHSSRDQTHFLTGDFDWVWAEAEAAAVPVTVMLPGLPQMAQALARILQRHPDLRLSLDHLNLAPHLLPTNRAALMAAIAPLIPLANYSNFALKTTAMAALMYSGCRLVDVSDALAQLFDTYGSRRLFWGTDLSRSPVGYSDAINLFTEQLSWLSAEDLAWIMGRGLCEWLDWPMDSTC